MPTATLALDFNTTSSPTPAGFTGVKPAAYTSLNHLGWQSISGIGAYDRSISNPLVRDFQGARQGTFLADVPNGTYDLAVGMGDYSSSTDKISIYAENQLITGTAGTGRREFLEARGRVTVTDGQLTLNFKDNGGSTPTFALNYLTLNPVDNSAKSIFPVDFQPASTQQGSGVGYEVGVRFQASSAGFVSGVRFYKGSGNTGVHTGTLWTAAGVKLASATFTSETTSGWQEVQFSQPVAVSANTTYLVTYSTPTGSYSYTKNYFAISGQSNGLLSAVKDASGGAGVSWKTGSAPATTYQNTNFGVDVVFARDTTPPDTTPPTVTGVNPANLSTNLAVDTKVIVTFSENMLAASVNSNSVWLRTKAGQLIATTVSYDAATKSATITPAASLANLTDYEIVINGKLTTSPVTDLAGNPLDTTVVSGFRTISAAPTASISLPQTINEGATVSFTGQVSGGQGPFTYDWDFGDGTTHATGTLTPTHSYADDGSYVVKLTVKDAANNTVTSTKTATVANVSPTATLSNNGPVIINAPVTITVGNAYDPSPTDTQAGFVYSFDYNNDGVWDVTDASSPTATTTFSTSGTQVVRARIKDKNGGFNDYTTQVTINTGVAPAAPSNLAVTPVSQSEISLTWDLGDASETNIVIERKTGANGVFKTLATLSAGENIFTDTSCWASTSYYYRVKTSNSNGSSSYSPVVGGTTAAVASGAMTVPTNLVATPNADWSVTISFTDTNSNSSPNFVLERSSDGMSYQVLAMDSVNSFTDVGLEPGKTYSYRVRATSWTAPTSDYSAPTVVAMPSLASNLPVAPTNLTVTNLSSSSNLLTWTNNGGATQKFKIERADLNPYYKTQTWTQIAVSVAGANSFTDTGLSAESAYVYRVRATNAAGDSPNAIPNSDVYRSMYGDAVPVVTASAGTGSAKTYDIGPGLAYPSIASLNWSILGPGDTVNIHYKPGGYHELFQIAVRGTQSNWITINGVPDPVSGALPDIDGAGAVLAPQFENHYRPVDGSGVIVVGARPGYNAGYKPGYLNIQNLRIHGSYGSNTFTDVDGSVHTYGDYGTGVYLERADHVTLKKLQIDDNGQGVFGAGQSSFDRLMTDITLDSNNIFNNGNVGSYGSHNTYIEAVGTLYQFNNYGPTRAGAGGCGLKDRSVGTVIRYNYIEGGAHQIQLAEAQNQVNLALALPRYRETLIYGNVLVTPSGNAASTILYGGDQGLYAFYRKGTLKLYNNTLVIQVDRSDAWHTGFITLTSFGESLDARNNIFSYMRSTGAYDSYVGLVGTYGMAYFGSNVLSKNITLSSDGSGFLGNAAGLSNLLYSTGYDPGFVSPSTNDFHLLAGSIAIDRSSRLSASELLFAPDYQYNGPAGGRRRSIVGLSADIGAFEFGV